jgi:hypothetical protein
VVRAALRKSPAVAELPSQLAGLKAAASIQVGTCAVLYGLPLVPML